MTAFAAGLGGPVRTMYEAGPTGFVLARPLEAAGVDCLVCAAGADPRAATDRAKTDRRDAERLVTLLAAGELHRVVVPGVQEAGAVWLRAREDLVKVASAPAAVPRASWTVAPDDVAEGDRIFESHVKCMTGHPQEGDTALLSYKVSKGPELSNPVDPSSDPTGNTIFVLSEVYETPAGVAEHWKQAVDSWQDLPAFMDWSGKVKVGTLHSGTVIQGLW